MDLSRRAVGGLVILAIGLLAPIGLFIFRWVEWDFQPSWMAAAQFFSNIYIPLFTLVPVLGLAYQILKKSRSDKAAFLTEGFRRQCGEMMSAFPGSPDSAYDAMMTGLLRGERPPHASLLFLSRNSRFVHSVLAIGYSLAELRAVDPTAAHMLRMELFTLIERVDFSKYEFIANACVSPLNYRWICAEQEEMYRDAMQ